MQSPKLNLYMLLIIAIFWLWFAGFYFLSQVVPNLSESEMLAYVLVLIIPVSGVAYVAHPLAKASVDPTEFRKRRRDQLFLLAIDIPALILAISSPPESMGSDIAIIVIIGSLVVLPVNALWRNRNSS